MTRIGARLCRGGYSIHLPASSIARGEYVLRIEARDGDSRTDAHSRCASCDDPVAERQSRAMRGANNAHALYTNRVVEAGDAGLRNRRQVRQ